MGVTFEVLGPLAVIREGVSLDLGAPRLRVLLTVLIVNARRVVTADDLIERLWFDGRVPRSARNIVHGYISDLRRLLNVGPGPDLLLRSSDGYILDVPPEVVDSSRFARLVGEAQAARPAAPAVAASAASDALSLWRGRPLRDAEGYPFAQPEIARLEHLHASACEVLADAELALGRHLELLPRLERLVAEHPLNEALHGALMLAMYRSGRHGDALVAYDAVCAALAENLGALPGPDLRKLHSKVLAHDPELAPPRRPDNLPGTVSSFVGRTAEREELIALVRAERLVTLTGSAGSGKTRLGLEVARAVAPEQPGGAWWVDLTPVSDPALVPAVIDCAIHGAESRDQTSAEALCGALGNVEALCGALGNVEALLVLDNCEHLLDACAEVAYAVLQRCTAVRVLVTSREPLSVPGEIVYPVVPLAVPRASVPAADLASYDGIRLFCERAASAHPGFALTDGNAESVVSICRRLDGIPLAIEFAAATVRGLSVAEIDRGLDDRFSLLVGQRAARHETLAASIDWSYRLLGNDEATLLARLSVFGGAFDREAVAAVCGQPPLTPASASAALVRLVDRSLVVADTTENVTRYRLLETIRAFAALRLDEAGETASLSERHARHFLEVAREGGANDRELLVRLSRNIDNLRAATEHALHCRNETLALELISRAWPYWWVRGPWSEPRTRIEAALAGTSGDSVVRARVLLGAGALAWQAGDLRSAADMFSRAVTTARQASRPRVLARALAWLSLIENLAAPASACGTAKEAMAAAATCDDAVAYAQALTVLANFEHDTASAYAQYRDALDRFRASGSHVGTGFALHQLAMTALRAGDLPVAREAIEERLAHVERTGDVMNAPAALGPLSHIELLTGNYDEAERLAARSLADAQRVGAAQIEALAARYLGLARYAVGDGEGAAAQFEHALGLWERMGNECHRAWALLDLADAARLRDCATARPRYEAALRATEADWAREIHGPALIGLARVALTTGNPRDAERHIARAAETIPSDWVPSMIDLLETEAAIAEATGRVADAVDRRRRAAAMRSRCGYVQFAVDRRRAP